MCSPRGLLALAAAFALTQTGCLAHALAGIGSDTKTSETFQIPPAESDAQLTCDNAPCSQVTVEQDTRRGRSKAIFWTVFAAETIGSIASYAAFITSITSSSSTDVSGGGSSATSGDPGGTSIGGALVFGVTGALLFTTALIDIIVYAASNDYGPQQQPFLLARPATASWRGAKLPLDVGDIVSYNALSPPSSFSIADALRRRQAVQAPAPLVLGSAATSSSAPAAAPPVQSELQGKLAVLDLVSSVKELSDADARFFGDRVRASALRHAPGLQVITRENLIVLLQASGKELANCEGECEVDTGRRIGADFIVSGDILKVGTRFKIALRLHETHEGKLLSATVASGTSIDELDDSLGKAAADLFRRAP